MDNFKQVLKFIDKLVDNEHAGKIIQDIDLKVGFSFDFIEPILGFNLIF